MFKIMLGNHIWKRPEVILSLPYIVFYYYHYYHYYYYHHHHHHHYHHQYHRHLGEEVDELRVVSGRDGGQSGVRGGHEGCEASLQELAQRRPIIG